MFHSPPVPSARLAASAARAQPAIAPARDMAEWRCAMEELRELEYQFARARQAGHRDLMLSLGSELHAATVRADLLLAQSVATARQETRAKAADGNARAGRVAGRPAFNADAKTGPASADRP
jgi:hypothetical protein